MSAINQFGIDVVLEPFMSELKILEQEGILIEVNGQKVNFKGTISLASGDNLSSHLLGGCKSPSGAIRICRHCMATSDEAQTNYLEGYFALRTRETFLSLFIFKRSSP
uniref:Uncharacterized protein n=1 Tax=Amphimedon queenslandica TaxID=400682 RepID=A0A1X7UN94_AMPQE